MEARLPQGEPVRFVRDGFSSEEAEDDAEGLVHALPLRERIDPEHVGVRSEGARADTEHRAAAGQVLELADGDVGKHRLMIVQQCFTNV